MSTYEITCINKTDRQNPWERIRGVGGRGPSGTFWMTQQEVIDRIKAGDSFFVDRGGHRVAVVIAVSRFGNEYIKTEKDGEQPNNLLSLPEC